MKTALQITSWIAVILGVLAIIGGFTAMNSLGERVVDSYAILGGLLFFLQGVLALVYIDQSEKAMADKQQAMVNMTVELDNKQRGYDSNGRIQG